MQNATGIERGDILIIGGGIGGLTLALSLHALGIRCRVFEAAPEIRALGVGINLLPHAMRELTDLGLEPALSRLAVTTREMVFCNRFGQFIHREPRGRAAGYEWPQLSIHRGDLHMVLLEAVNDRLGPNSVSTGSRCIGFEQDPAGVTVSFGGSAVRGIAAVGCDGIHSVFRKQLHPAEPPVVYNGINMWRGVTRAKPFLTGASMIAAGWLESGKMAIYPIRNDIDGERNQLINWVAEIQSPRNVMQDWNLPGRLADFYPTFEAWRFPWLDVAALIRNADKILEYPMVDREPLPSWGSGRVTLLGDAAHPMHPRGSNGAAQAILDARTLAGCLNRQPTVEAAFKEYEGLRLPAANEVVIANRSLGPDALLREVYQRTGDRPFDRIENVITGQEIETIAQRYKVIAGFERDQLSRRHKLA
jgi:2-polyprenyl-6-methoxyphenol hydroxylase-like FAD-dependent oxidoreductase